MTASLDLSTTVKKNSDALYADTRGNLWTGGRSGARRYRLPENPCSVENHSFERIKPPPINNQISDQISTILETEDGDIWLNNYGVSKEKTGRLLLWHENAPLEIYGNSDGLPGTVSGEKDDRIFISDIALARLNGRESLLVADQSGIFRFDGKRFVKEIVQTRSFNDRVRFTYDREGNLIVNFIDSIARLTKEDRWELISAKELEGKQARAFFADREGNIWLGTFTDGLWRLKRNFIEFFDESKGVAKNQTAAVMEDAHGNLWIAGYGLHRFENGKFMREQTVPEAYFIALAEQRDGTLLIGGYDKLFARRTDGSVTDLTNEIKADIGNVPFAIKSIYEDSRGNL